MNAYSCLSSFVQRFVEKSGSLVLQPKHNFSYISILKKQKKLFLILNAGSSSLKYKLFEEEFKSDNLLTVCKGNFEISQCSQTMRYYCKASHFNNEDKEIVEKMDIQETEENSSKLDFNHCMEVLFNNLSSMDLDIMQMDDNQLSIGHRIVHGGCKYSSATIINESVLKHIQKCAQFAPLHNPFQLQCIQACNNMLNNSTQQFAVFDTSFHACLPKSAYTLPINANVLHDIMLDSNDEMIAIRKYGFHGISYEYILDRVSSYLSMETSALNLIVCHLGSGCSMCCIMNGISIETSMGFTPSQGLMMGTRSGDIDPGMFKYLNDECINEMGGLKGICGSTDMRVICIKAQENEDNEYKLAVDMFCHSIRKYIGSYYALLNGNLSAIVFTGGIGQNMNRFLLDNIFCNMNGLGFVLETESSQIESENSDLNIRNWADKDSGIIPILTIKTDEELAIAQQVQKAIGKSYDI